MIRTWRQVFSAVLALSCMTGPVGERLRYAYWHHLKELPIDRPLPEDLRAELERLLDDLAQAFPAPDARGEPPQATELAQRLVALYDRLAHLID